MSLLYDEGQQAIATESRRILEARVAKEALLPLLEQSGQYHTAFWDTAKEQGWTALALSERYDGLDLGLIELGLIAHQAGRSISGAPFLTSSYGAVRAILDYGTDTLKDAWLKKLASGEAIGAIAFAEGQTVLASDDRPYCWRRGRNVAKYHSRKNSRSSPRPSPGQGRALQRNTSIKE